jgi:r-opsin
MHVFVHAYFCILHPVGYCYYFIVTTIFDHEKTLREQAKKMNVTSLRSNADSNAASAEIKIAKVALCNIALWAAMWTPYASIVLKVSKFCSTKIENVTTIIFYYRGLSETNLLSRR